MLRQMRRALQALFAALVAVAAGYCFMSSPSPAFAAYDRGDRLEEAVPPAMQEPPPAMQEQPPYLPPAAAQRPTLRNTRGSLSFG